MSEKIGQLKLKSQDGKYRLTDVCDIEEMFRIIESIPSKNAEPIKQWLASLGRSRRYLVKELGEHVVTNNNALNYEYVDKKMLEKK